MSRNINLCFHDELNDFLPVHLRYLEFQHELKNNRSVKDLIESLGVPHTEVDLIIVNGESVDFEYGVQAGDNIELYPPLNQAQLEKTSLAAMPASALKHCQPEALSHPRFVADVHLGRLAAYLRFLGFDTLYRNDYEDALLADISADEQRILFSCDRQLLMRKQVIYGYFVRARQPQQQLLEIISRFELHNRLKPFTRCMHCNGELQAVDKQTIEAQLPPKTGKYYNEFFQCPQCKKIYWKGSHYLKLRAMINRIKNDTAENTY
ncbi:MAG: Mut7-C RNAse domain-containing protein [Gammaproteobacteria bacterium]|nr:Mut7-C RNAse domain-containing protein [Gammaproteobacteria bacterium]